VTRLDDCPLLSYVFLDYVKLRARSFAFRKHPIASESNDAVNRDRTEPVPYLITPERGLTSTPVRDAGLVMLKDWWYKARTVPLGAYFRSGPRKLSAREIEDYDMLQQITHTGEFHLIRLEECLSRRFDRRWNIKTSEGISAMISVAARIQDRDIQRELLLFYLNCPPLLQNYLRNRTLKDNRDIFRTPN